MLRSKKACHIVANHVSTATSTAAPATTRARRPPSRCAIAASLSVRLRLMALGFVRPARSVDADEIARLQLSTWRTAYRRMLPAQVLDQIDEGYLARGWREAI